MKDKKSIKDWAIDDRPREKLIENGAKSLSNAELLAIIIGSGNSEKSAIDVAREILDDCNNKVNILCKKSFSDLGKYTSIGNAKAAAILAAIELGRRREDTEKPKSITNSSDLFSIVKSGIMDLEHEESYAIFLNKANSPIKIFQTSKGGIDSTVIDKRLIIGEALKLKASGIALIHNHPSGNLTPSRSDDIITEEMEKACKMFDIFFIDHLIIGGNKYYSYRDNLHILG